MNKSSQLNSVRTSVMLQSTIIFVEHGVMAHNP